MSYAVRIELRIQNTDFALHTVEADSIEEAKQKAISEYESGELDLDYYASDAMESELDTESVKDWVVEELEPTIDREALIDDLTEISCENMDLKDLEAYYKEGQVEYFEKLKNKEMLEHALKYGDMSKQELIKYYITE